MAQLLFLVGIVAFAYPKWAQCQHEQGFCRLQQCCSFCFVSDALLLSRLHIPCVRVSELYNSRLEVQPRLCPLSWISVAHDTSE